MGNVWVGLSLKKKKEKKQLRGSNERHRKIPSRPTGLYLRLALIPPQKGNFSHSIDSLLALPLNKGLFSFPPEGKPFPDGVVHLCLGSLS